MLLSVLFSCWATVIQSRTFKILSKSFPKHNDDVRWWCHHGRLGTVRQGVDECTAHQMGWTMSGLASICTCNTCPPGRQRTFRCDWMTTSSARTETGWPRWAWWGKRSSLPAITGVNLSGNVWTRVTVSLCCNKDDANRDHKDCGVSRPGPDQDFIYIKVVNVTNDV